MSLLVEMVIHGAIVAGLLCLMAWSLMLSWNIAITYIFGARELNYRIALSLTWTIYIVILLWRVATLEIN
jgi:hypothetical protein